MTDIRDAVVSLNKAGPGGLCDECGHMAGRHVGDTCGWPERLCSCTGMLWRGIRIPIGNTGPEYVAAVLDTRNAPQVPAETGNLYARHTDPQTSKDASHETPERITIYDNLFRVFARTHKLGTRYTPYEITVAAGYIAGYQDDGVPLAEDGARRRVSDLVRDGYIGSLGITRRGPYRKAKDRDVYQLTMAGIDEARTRGWL